MYTILELKVVRHLTLSWVNGDLRILAMLRRLAYDLCYTPHRCHNHKVNRNNNQIQCRGMWSSVSSYLPYQQADVSRNYRNCSTNTFLCKQRATVNIFNYQLKIGFDNSSQFSSRHPLVFSTNGSFGPNFLSQENGFKRFFSSSKEINLLTSPSPKEVSKKAAAGNGKLPQRHSLTTLFRGSQRTKKLTTYNSLHAEVKVNGSQQSTEVGTSKSEVSKKNKPVDSKRKNRVSKAKSNKTKDTKIQTREPIQNDALSDVVKVKCQKTSRAEKTHGSGKSIKTKASGEFSYLEKAGKGRGKLAPLFPPDGKSVMVVESATKAKTIQNYLGELFDVLPTYGHVRDLAGRSGSVRPDDEFSMVWEVPSSAWTHLKTIKVALTGAQNLILATDPDREGEAIAWHLIEMLHQQDALNKDINVSRVVFHEITDAAIKNSLLSPRNLDLNLINAYLARRALDYLIGFNVSPLLWRKLPGCQSAGRVQSAALALICDREMEIDQFKPQEYWTVEVGFLKTDNDASIMTKLTHFDSKKLNQFSIDTQMEAQSIENKILSSNFVVLSSKTNNIRKIPPMPYITSSLQQDSANKLHFAAAYTMKLAQKLYEGVTLSDEKATGLITYMRTDGLHISDAAAKDVHSLIKERYGQNFASKDIRKYFKKVKNAQEAHEAIRPTNISRLPSSLVGILDEDSLKLYTLIWVRTLACQMEAAISNVIQVDIGSMEENIILHGSGSKLEFLGYHAAYKDSEAEIIRLSDSENIASNDETFRVLSSLKVKDQLHLKKVESKQHHTKPPGRYSEGSLVKKLEELGIGRPSTYAPILKVLQDRKYVMTKNRVLFPEFRGRMVSAFLSHHFSEVSDYSFTADMENELDNVSAGATEWKGLLKDYWSRFKNYCDLAGNVNIRQLEKMLEKKFGHILFGDIPDQSRTCPSCLEGSLVFKISRYGTGYFIGCDQHPKCKHISGSVLSEDEDDIHPGKPDGCFQPKLLGHSPDTDEKILLKKGPYGYYVQLGDDRKECPPKRASLEVKDIDSLTVEDAMELLRYPISLGNHPEDGAPVILSHSKCGFSIRHRRTISPVPKTKDPKKITLEVALKLLTSKKAKQTGRRTNKPVYTDKILSSS